ncbi:MAG: HAMP domain-containing histidine kinase [Lachnospiraceae bacterium]|nr:HAMP domain-containing histidine kinase [Lachnospiraceae bacterium]
MKFKTRLRVTFISIILLPLLLTVLAFMIIGVYLVNIQKGYDLRELDYAMMNDNLKDFVGDVDRMFGDLLRQAERDPSVFGDAEYLEKKNAELSRRSTYLLVRKGKELFYSGNAKGETLFGRLPEYGSVSFDEKGGYYFDDLECYVKQIDFSFPDGSEGTVFVVTRMHAMISKKLVSYMFIAIVLILLFTSFMLTNWIHKGVFTPITELNMAMKKIKDGNFDYMLETNVEGEIGDLYRNYEDMRLRLKESAEEKDDNEKRNRELISNISHDLKTPITAIKGYVEGIMDGVADTPEKMDKYIRTIYNKANDMDKLINELTTYSSIDNHRIQYNFQRINVADYFGDCVEEVGLDLESRNIKLNYTNMADPSTLVIADAEQMKKVINNIIGNSVKYMDKPNGRIDIRILDQDDSIQVEIEDNGKGIAAKDLQRIFDRFYRTDASRNSAQGGSGIGLSIVKKIIEDHGGYIWATAKEGEGTCMHFVLRKYVELT